MKLPGGWSRDLLLFTLAAIAAACGGSKPGDSSATRMPASGASPAPATSLAARPSGHPVVFVGLDGADWQLLDPLMARGLMPNLARLVSEGRSGVLLTQHPPLSPLVWTSMMTGQSPLEHRILDFTRFNPQSGVREPITSDERAVPAIWNMAAAAGLPAAVLGMWATYPAEDGVGLVVSDRAIQLGDTGGASVSPAGQAAQVEAAHAAAVASLDLAALQRFLPGLTEAELARAAAKPVGEAYGEPVSALRRILVETRTMQGLALSAGRSKPRLLIAYFEGTDTIGHVFAPFAPPRQPGISAADYARFSRVPELYFAEIDRDLGAWRALAAESGAVLMVASDHGFRWREGRPRELSSLAAASAARWHRDEGIYLLWGTGIGASTASGHGGRGNAAQVCSTLLALLGLPPARGIDPTPLPGAANEPEGGGPAVDYAAVFHRPPGVASHTDQTDPAEALARLRALGYLGSGETGATRLPGSTRTPASFNNEGLLRRERGETAPAVTAFQQALTLDPHYASAAWNLSELLAAEDRDLERSDALLIQALREGLPEGPERLVARAAAYRERQGAARSVHLLDGAAGALPRQPAVFLYRGRYRLELQDCSGARDDFARSLDLDGRNAIAHASLGTALLCLGDEGAARRSFRESLRLDPEQPELRKMLAGLGG